MDVLWTLLPVGERRVLDTLTDKLPARKLAELAGPCSDDERVTTWPYRDPRSSLENP